VSNAPSAAQTSGSPVKVSSPAPEKPSSAAVKVSWPADVSRAAIGHNLLLEIDESTFRTSQPADQVRLRAALQAFRATRYSQLHELLIGATRAIAMSPSCAQRQIYTVRRAEATPKRFGC
jgi:hypothetical protein